MKCLEFKMLYSSYCKMSLSRSSPPRILSYLTSSIDDFRCELLSIVFDDPTEGVFDRRVITLYKMMLDKTNRAGGFACESYQQQESVIVR